MDQTSIEKFRLDRRLIGRRGWVTKQELAREFEALPDAAESATTLGEASDASEPSPPPVDGQIPQG